LVRREFWCGGCFGAAGVLVRRVSGGLIGVAQCGLGSSDDQEATMATKRLQVGDRAPDYEGIDQNGKSVRSSDFVGSRPVVIFFYPKDNTPVCTKEACAFRDSYAKFSQIGAEVIGVSGDGEASHRGFAERYRLPFSLLSDTDGTLRAAFGVPKTLGLFPGRVTYVIDREGVIRLVFSAQLASDGHVKAALEALIR